MNVTPKNIYETYNNLTVQMDQKIDFFDPISSSLY